MADVAVVCLMCALAVLMLIAGRKLVFSELQETEDLPACVRGRRIWCVLSLLLSGAALFLFIRFRVSVTVVRLFILLYAAQYSLLTGIVDAFSHNYYLETLPGLLLFIPAGCLSWGTREALWGALAGICCGALFALAEWLFFRDLTLGGGDALYGAAASGLVGYSNFGLYWSLFVGILLVSAVVHVIYVKAVKKEPLAENRFVPLLPWFGLLTTFFYAFSILK